MAVPEVRKTVRDIKAVRIQGAREIAKAGLKALGIQARKSKAGDRGIFISELEKAAVALIKTRPTEPGLRHTIFRVLQVVRAFDTRDVAKLKKATLKAIDDALDELEGALKKIAYHGAGLIKSGDVVMTHCHSHSVVEVLREAKGKGRKFKVIVTETRPLYQGIKTAKDLLKSRIPVIYCEDSAVGYFMRIATKVLVGCDAILRDGSVVNKIGTLPMAIVAREFGKPFYSAGGTIKITPEVTLEMREEEEIIEPRRLPGAKIVNPAFDLTPAEFVEGIVTERGVLKPGEIGRFA